MKLQKSVYTHCEKNGIEVNQDSFSHYEFIAPAGKVFANDSRYRIVDIEGLKVSDTIDEIVLFDDRAVELTDEITGGCPFDQH